MTNPSPPNNLDLGKLFLGLFIIALGIVFWLDQVGYLAIDRDHLRVFWPMILIVLGASKLLSPGQPRGSGLVLLTLGVLFQLHTLDIFDFHQSWPLIIVATGAAIAWKALREPSHPIATRENHHA